MEIKVESVQLPEKITFNYAELKSELQTKLEYYKTLAYTEEEIQTAKKDKATLNKLKKALNDERVRQEKEYMKPFALFKEQVNELISMVDEPVRIIDKQVKAYEEYAKDKKRQDIKNLLSVALPYGIDPNRLFDEKWMNIKSMKAIKKEVDEKIEKVKGDCQTLEGLSEYQDVAILEYRRTLDIRAALDAITAEKKKAEQIARIQEERQSIPEIEEPEEVQPAEPKPTEEPRVWVSFSAYLNRSEATALNRYMQTRGITFKKI